MNSDLMALLAGAYYADVGHGLRVRILSAHEVMQARREASALHAADGRERALCANACLLARALERDGSAVFPSGAAVLDGLSAPQIEVLSKRWAQLNAGENPSPQDERERVDALKKVWSTRLTHAFNGVCSGLWACFPPRRGRAP